MHIYTTLLIYAYFTSSSRDFKQVLRKITGQKYISNNTRSISEQEARGYTLSITDGFKKVVEQAVSKSGISMHRLNIDFMGMQKEITRKIMGGKFDEISGVLSLYVEKACPGREAGCPGKLNTKKFDKFMAEFNKEIDVALNQPMQQALHTGSSTLNNIKEQQISMGPKSYINNTSVQSHLTQARDLRLR